MCEKKCFSSDTRNYSAKQIMEIVPPPKNVIKPQVDSEVKRIMLAYPPPNINPTPPENNIDRIDIDMMILKYPPPQNVPKPPNQINHEEDHIKQKSSDSEENVKVEEITKYQEYSSLLETSSSSFFETSTSSVHGVNKIHNSSENNAIWNKIINNWKKYKTKKYDKLKKKIRKGIPDEFRELAWKHMLHQDNKKKDSILLDCQEIERLPIFDKVDNDILEHFPILENNKSADELREKMKRILYKYLSHNSNAVYSKKLCYVLAPIVLVMKDNAYNSFLFIMKKPNLSFFMENKKKTKYAYQLNVKISTTMPRLYKHFEKEDIQIEEICIKWFETILQCLHLPKENLLKVYDKYLLCGYNSVLNDSIKEIQKNAKKLISMNKQEIIEYFEQIYTN